MWIFWPNSFQFITLFELLSSAQHQGKANHSHSTSRPCCWMHARATQGWLRCPSPTCGNSTTSNKMQWGPRTRHIAYVQMAKKKGEGLQNKIKRKKLERRVQTPNECRGGDFPRHIYQQFILGWGGICIVTQASDIRSASFSSPVLQAGAQFTRAYGSIC